MSLEGLIIGLTVLAITVLWIAAPLLTQRRTLPQHASEREALLTRYEQLLTSIRDLDEDSAMGKIRPEAYSEERESLVQQGIALLKAIDATGEPGTRAEDEQIDQQLDRQIEKAIAAQRRKLHVH